MSVADILKDKDLSALLHVLNPESDCTRIVGGAVRNALLDEPVDEIDLATKLLPQRVSTLCEEAGYKAVPTGIDFGTVTIVIGKRSFEVTTLREDIETDGRHAVVKFGTSWEKDAARRDFTINALYLDRDGKVHDPCGGLIDLKAGRVRFIGDAKRRIAEDYLRIWRFFRFSARYAKGEFDNDGLKACLASREGLPRLSAERVKQELFKLLVTPRAVEAVILMSELWLTASVLGVQYLLDLHALAGSDAKHNRQPDALERLAALCVRIKEDAERLSENLRLSRAETQRLVDIARALLLLRREPGEKLARLVLYRFPQAYDSAIRVAALSIAESWQAFIDLPLRRPVPAFPLKGADLIALGHAPGEQLGRKLKTLEDAWIESDFSLNRDALIKRVKN